MEPKKTLQIIALNFINQSINQLIIMRVLSKIVNTSNSLDDDLKTIRA
ncbi:hypothetical protein ADIWIN_3744 [Winogradskyella psychrotolerans RS-3]|uniref:Uncharacterized protein n=1 Tax=Winogradskyella psychrotolerans RS-3 TaxID=641526 RepID=S7X2M1_9FLAO|nr:hypothetical protein ADIWIN_3744 [Winogradskyella psychrotolerans RS-3]